MLLSESSFLTEFLRFLKLMFWVCLPFLFIAVLVTTYFHYRGIRKRKKEGEEEEEAGDFYGLPLKESSNSSFALADMLMTVNFKKRNKSNNSFIKDDVQHTALTNHFKQLQEKHTSLLSKTKKSSETSKIHIMEKLQLEIQETLQEQINNMKEHHAAEKAELNLKLQQVREEFADLEKENNKLRDEITRHYSADNETEITNSEWADERAQLKHRLSELECLQEVLEEKRMQIEFLQNQLEHRIRNHHMLEQQFREVNNRFTEIKSELERRQLLDADHEALLANKDQEISGLKETFQSNSNQLIQMEGIVSSLHQQNENLTKDLSEMEQTIINLKEILATEAEEKEQVIKKLEANQKLFRSLYHDISGVLEETVTESPVILMKADYPVKKEEEELTELVGH